MKRINIEELLKNCPKGMELDCTVFDTKVTYRGLSTRKSTHPVLVQTEHGLEFELTQYGQIHNIVGSKCVIFPKGKTTWEGFVPPCPFKDGDILYAIDEGNEYIFIFKEVYENERVYCHLNLKGGNLRIQEVWITDYNPTTHRFATEEEKQKLFDAIKANGYKWNADTKTLEKLIKPKFKVGDRIKHRLTGEVYMVMFVISNGDEGGVYDVAITNEIGKSIDIKEQDNYELAKFDITTLKPFDKVLVRDSDEDMWCASIFSHTWKDKYFCVGAWHNQCIPYKGNEYLLGTINDCNVYYKTWE